MGAGVYRGRALAALAGEPVKPSVLAFMVLLVVFVVGVLVHAHAMAQANEPTQEDRLRLQIVLLRGQLAEALKAQAKCEADGSAASKQIQEAQKDGQELVKALDARGLMVNPQNEIVPKPTAEKKP